MISLSAACVEIRFHLDKKFVFVLLERKKKRKKTISIFTFRCAARARATVAIFIHGSHLVVPHARARASSSTLQRIIFNADRKKIPLFHQHGRLWLRWTMTRLRNILNE